MQIRIFTIPVMGGEALMEEMNVFLRSKKILHVKERLVGGKDPNAACWCFSIRYVDDVAAAERERAKVDEPREPRRLVEQRRAELPRRLPQQQHAGQPEQQHRLPARPVPAAQ